MDWKMRSAGAPASMARICVVMCASTQICVGISYLRLISSKRVRMRFALSAESPAGFRPITASPAPKLNPSSTDATMPSMSSVGWFGCRRHESVPGRPMVVLQCAVTGIFFAQVMRSRLLISLQTPATISLVRPRRTRAMSAAEVVSASSHSRSSATLQPRISL